MTKQAIGGAHKGGEVMALLETCLQVLPFLLLLLCCYHLIWIPVVVGLCICVCHLDIHDAVSTAHPKAAKKNISSVIFTCGLVVGTTDRTSIRFFNTTTWANQGFFANGRGSERFSSQVVYQLISDFIVSENHEATFLTA